MVVSLHLLNLQFNIFSNFDHYLHQMEAPPLIACLTYFKVSTIDAPLDRKSFLQR